MSKKHALVLQSDFGYVDGAVAAMMGVALSVDEDLRIYDLTHEIEPYNTWEASYRLFQAIGYWPEGTAFVSVVDPGVGTQRRSVVAQTANGMYIVTPDNGSLTHIGRYVGITGLREIDETRHLKASAEHSYTFYGRDLYANVGAKLAAGAIAFEEVGEALPPGSVVQLDLGPVDKAEDSLRGNIDILDVRFGSLWTNIPREEFMSLGIAYGDSVEIVIKNGNTLVYNNRAVFGKSFADVSVGEQIVYVNSLLRMAVAINQGNFARAYSVGTGLQWQIELRKVSGG